MTQTLRDYQEEAVAWLSRQRRALLIAPAGSGKTYMVAAGIRAVLARRERSARPKVLWLANTKEQVAQAQAALALWCGEEIELKAACVAGVNLEDIVDWKPSLIVIDEAHHLRTAATWQALARAHDGTLWACTATPWGNDEEANDNLREIVKGSIYTVERSRVTTSITPLSAIEMIEFAPRAGLRSEIAEYVRKRSTPWMSDKDQGKILWTAVRTLGIEQHIERTDAIWRAAQRYIHDPMLVLVPTKRLGSEIERRCNGRLVTSETPHRRRILDAYLEGRFNVLIATSLADEGLDLPRAAILVNLAGGRSEARTEQRAGRVMRVDEGKTDGIVIDALDSWHPLAAKHSQIRLDVYRRLTATK